MSRPRRALFLLLAIFIMMAAPDPAVSRQDRPEASAKTADDCNKLMRRLKLDVFDEKWEQVRIKAVALLNSSSSCPHKAQVAYLKAQALARLGREQEALEGYGDFLEDYCATPGGPVNCDLARSARYELAARLYRKDGRRKHLDLLLDSLDLPGDAGIMAALTLADIDDPAIRKRALPYLLKAFKMDLDDDVASRICLAVLKIDPAKTPCGQAPQAGGSSAGPTLISVEIFDFDENKVQLRINMPVALAEVVIRSLPPEILEEMSKEGIDIQSIFQTIREQTDGPLFEMTTQDQRIRIWLH
ncbi:MAG: hypothetical protein ACE5ID_11400 [Acidobacteriota bacterium]